MKYLASAAIVALLAPAALADKKLDDAVAKAYEQIEKGRPEEGLKNLQKVVSQQNTAEAWVELARFQHRTGALDDALASAKKAGEVAAAPADKAAALAALSSYDLLLGSGSDALAHAQQAVAAQETPASLAALARAQARVQDSVAALASADKALGLAAQNALAHEAKGDALLAASRAADAVAAYRKAVELDPKAHRARVGLANALLESGKATEAVAEARKVTTENDKSAEGYATLGMALLKESPNNWNAAIAEAQQGAFLNPKNVNVQLAVGRIFEAAGNFDQAALAYSRASQTDPGFAPAALAVIETQERKGDLDGALAAAQKLVAGAPKSGEAQFLLGRLLLRKNDFAGAAKALKIAAEQASGIAEAHAYLGTALQYQGQTKEAVAAYAKAVERAPANTMFRATYGLLLGLDGEFDKGAAELQKVVATPGYKDTAGYTNLGWIYRSMSPRKPAESVAAYKKALELDPTNEQAALGMAWSHSYTQSYDQAIAAFEQAIKIEPKTAPEAYNGIAWCHFFKRDIARAKEFLDKAQGAGRSDPRLKDNIDKFEKLAEQREEYERRMKELQEEQSKGKDIAALQNAILRGAGAGVRIRAIDDFVDAAGRQAVPTLVGALVNDSSWEVRSASAKALGSLGAAASQALPYLQEMLNMECGKTIMDKKEMEESIKCEDAKRDARDAFLRIKR
jgi:tetratricopeptide (TPR) repeat protein